jgi:hypothetical protein
MIKSFVIYTVSFLILFLVIHFSQEFIINQLSISVRFNLWDTNLFFAIASLVICLHLKLFSSVKNLQSQLGFIYLPTLFIKGVLFFLMFRTSIFQLDTLEIVERLNLLIPLFLFLGLEVFFILKIITKTKT